MRYEKIIGLPHHTSRVRRRMSRENRAAQFAPYAALVGFDLEIAEEGRVTEDKTALTECEIERLNRLICEAYEYRLPVTVTYFLKDKLKSGGKYVRAKGVILSLDPIAKSLRLETGEEIPLLNIIDIEELEK